MMAACASERSVQLPLIQSGKLNQNTYIELQRPLVRRMIQLVRKPNAVVRLHRDRSLAKVVQRRTTEECAGRADTSRVFQIAGGQGRYDETRTLKSSATEDRGSLSKFRIPIAPLSMLDH
jgi:hypothetical protein